MKNAILHLDQSSATCQECKGEDTMKEQLSWLVISIFEF
jgi:hypothetical protein